MNCPSRTDETLEHEGYNQNPPSLAADLTTREDLNGIANIRLQRLHKSDPGRNIEEAVISPGQEDSRGPDHFRPNMVMAGITSAKDNAASTSFANPLSSSAVTATDGQNPDPEATLNRQDASPSPPPSIIRRVCQAVWKFATFIGPGFMISVAYIDPGNYSTDVAGGATLRFKLLFIVFMSNVFAIFLQSLCIKLGTVTGLDLAENCRAHLPKWLNLVLYFFAESAIIVTDIAEVIGSAIALNMLIHVPLVAGCALTILDVMVILLFYDPTGSMRRLRAFEFIVISLVFGVVICFCVELSLITNTSVGEVFRGYLPSSAIVQADGLYLSCGILGATVMPHSLYLGSGLVQSRLRDFDHKAKNRSTTSSGASEEPPKYRPSLAAIKYCLNYSIAELAICLFTFALFVNSAILIVAGSTLSDDPSAQNADLFSIHDLLSQTLAPAAGTIFALALLLSGTSAGIICTIAGQMVSEGALNWTVRPWLRRLITRSISITPSIIIAGAVGKDGLSAALNGTQVALSVILPFVSAPLIYFTCRNRYMTVTVSVDGTRTEMVKMRNDWITAAFAVVTWLVICVMNVSLLVLVGLGNA